MKKQIRTYVLEKRKYIDKENKDKLILKNLFSLPEYKSARNILCYYPLKYEISTLECFEDTSKNWFLPRINGENLEICVYDKDDLKLGQYNIIEPQGEEISSLSIIDLVLVPALAADKNGYRLGYGKGYYDRFFSMLESKNIYPVKIALIYCDFLKDTIYPDKYDEKVDIIVSDREILRM